MAHTIGSSDRTDIQLRPVSGSSDSNRLLDSESPVSHMHLPKSGKSLVFDSAEDIGRNAVFQESQSLRT